MRNSLLNLWKLTTIAIIALFISSESCPGWQDDPFDPFATDDTEVPASGDKPSGSSPIAPPIDDALDDGVKLVIKNLRDANPTTPRELARAVRTMLNVRQYAEAKVYLQRLINSALDDNQMYELMSLMGPDFFLELRDLAELNPEGNEFALSVFKSSQRAAYAPNRIAQLIEQLGDTDQYIRAEATRSLKQVGAPAAAEMLNYCAVDANKKRAPYILAALKQMGDSAILPLLGVARNDGTIPQAVAVSVLADIKSPVATDPLYRASVSSKVPPAVRAIAAAAVMRRNRGSGLSIEQRINDRTQQYLRGNIQLPINSNNEVVVWNWDLDQQRLIPTTANKLDAAKLLAVDLARDAFRLNPVSTTSRQLQILAVLEATKRVIGPNRSMVPLEVRKYVPDVSATELDVVLGQAIIQNQIAAAIGASELLGQLGDSSLLSSVGTNQRNLIKAILHGNRHLQFAAANAISQINPQSAFPGSSYFAKLMAFLAQSTTSGSGIVAHQSPAAAQRIASFVGQSGLQGRVAFSPESLMAELNSNPDIELVIITDSFSHPRYMELVQQVRKNWMTRHLPIGLFVSNAERRRNAELLLRQDPGVLVMPTTSNPELIYGQIQKLLALHQPWRVSNLQRDRHCEIAIQWLNQAVSDPEAYRFYHLSCYRNQLARLLGTSDNWVLKSNIVSNLGTPRSQRELVNIAGQEGLPVEDRRVVVNAFERSVEKNGLLLTTDEILEQYARYNASRRQRAESQNILSSILDAIESKKPN